MRPSPPTDEEFLLEPPPARSVQAAAAQESPAAAHPAPPARPATTHPGGIHTEGFFTAVQSMLLVMVVALFIMTFVLQPFRIPSESMVPTLKVGDFLLVNKQAYSPRSWADALLPPSDVQRGDIVVFHYPVDPRLHVVKRVVAIPGDHLRLRDGQLFVNGKLVDEPYAYYSLAIPDNYRDDFPALHSMDANVDPQWWRVLRRNVRDGELYVPAGRFFVMGDNRNDSEDSRYWGFVPRPALVGRPFVVYFSLSPPSAGETVRQRLAEVAHTVRRIR
jgi:signal peptidase I